MLVAGAVTIVYATFPSATKSFTPVTVTVCAVFQFPDVNVTDPGATVPSVKSLDESPIVTFAVGWLVSTTVNVAVPPPSVVAPDSGVTVIVVEATAAMAYVMGEVNHPGAVNLQGPLTVIQALALAGGLKDFADAKNIRILRKGPAGRLETIAFNYKDAVKSSRAPIYLRPGDTVVVPD